ncbi:unnamed protein product [Echinostoma caproni]|uniref:DUF4819 domain-containing protein n=1 Tax=Echinostoma caproni TaxID=27848 RepID=A0A183AL18_9TREM|nr:unnamed protein product [Echinostoma caproni]
MLSVNTSSTEQKEGEKWSANVNQPITSQGHIIALTNHRASDLSQTEPQLASNETTCTRNSDNTIKPIKENNAVNHTQPLSTFVNCSAQLLTLVTENGYFPAGTTLTTVDHIYNVHTFPCSQHTTSDVTKLSLTKNTCNQVDGHPQPISGSSLVSIPVIPPSPYDVASTRVVYPSAASDTNSTCGTRRHFRRRVANYHQNQRHHSHHSQPRPVNLLNRVTKMRPNSDTQNGTIIWKNGTNRNTASLSPPVRCSSGTSDLGPSDSGNPTDVVERRATSVGPPTLHTGNQKDTKSGGSSDPLQSPSGGESLDVLSVDCMVNAWAHVDSGQPNRTLSNPLMHTSQTATASDLPGVTEFSQSVPDKTCAIRSRSHHQLMPCDFNESIELRTSSAMTNKGVFIGPLNHLSASNPTPPCSNTFCASCEWQSPGSNERAFTVLDRWYQRYYTISRNPDQCATKMLRSPISVLAPCKGE